MRMLADSSSGLDAVTYFFANSALFILITGAAFFVLGMLFGRLTWGRYKRRYERSEQEIESYKGELALLKRRLAEKASRPAPPPAYVPPAVVMSPPQPLSPLAALVRGGGKSVESPAAAAPRPSPPGQGFSIWTERDGSPTAAAPAASYPSAAFSLWTLPATEPEFVHGTEIRHKSHAHTIWTERSWKPHPPHGPPPPAAAAFSLWTLPDFVPSGQGAVLASQAFSLWTESSWSPAKISGLPPRSARSFSLWTDEDFEPTGRGAVLPSQAWSLWTTPDWEMPAIVPAPQPLSAAFTLWAEHVTPVEEPPSADAAKTDTTAPGTAKPPLNDQDLKKTKGSVFARALAAARAAFKTQESG
jgi:hypothetical protein